MKKAILSFCKYKHFWNRAQTFKVWLQIEKKIIKIDDVRIMFIFIKILIPV